jgi:hypothetical protein
LEKDGKFETDILREFSIFFAVTFLTCVVGIFQLLPQFDVVSWIWGEISVSIIYFGFLFGMAYSVDKCFWLYEQNRRFAKRFGFGFNFPDIEPYETRGRILKGVLIAGILVIFSILYFVKLHLLQ